MRRLPAGETLATMPGRVRGALRSGRATPPPGSGTQVTHRAAMEPSVYRGSDRSP